MQFRYRHESSDPEENDAEWLLTALFSFRRIQTIDVG